MRTFKKLFVFVLLFILFGLVFLMYKKNYEGFELLKVRNLPPTYTSGELQQLFSQHGSVASATVIKSGGSANGIVQASDDKEAQAMVKALNGTRIDGKSITVELSGQIKPKLSAKKPAQGHY